MGKKSILVVCVHNSARSQMAEEYFKLFGGDLFTAFTGHLMIPPRLKVLI